MRTTKKRQMVWDILKRSPKPLSAELVMALLKGEAMNLSTVYRNLDYLHQEGVLGKSVIEGSAYYYVNDGIHHHYMICRSCQKMVPLDCHLDALTKEIAQKERFTITHHDMTVYGYCRDCFEKLNS